MKTLLALGLLISCSVIQAQETNGAIEVQGMKGTFSTEKAEILKVYSAEQDGAEFRAYVVAWNGTEIVITDMPGIRKKIYQKGDTITFMINRIDLKREGSKPILSFNLLPDFERPKKQE